VTARSCDILVVGAGPAGSCAARAAACDGLKVIFVERKRAVGVPVRCAEYIPRALLGELPFSDRSFVVQPVEAMRTILPGGAVHETRAPGLMIRRDQFDRLLAQAAQEQGAELLVKTRFVGMEGGKAVLRMSDGSFTKVKAGIVIGADGPQSRVGRFMGSRLKRVVAGVQVRASLVAPMDQTEVYFDPRVYGGYAWLFPRGEEANVGLAIAKGSKWSISPRQNLEWFVELLNKRGRIKGEPHGLTAGWIPVKPVGASVRENMILAGDAAGQTHPITGAGVVQAVRCGWLAGKWAARAVADNDPELIQGYEEDWREDYGQTLDWASRRREVLESNWDRLEDILPSCWVAFRKYYERS